MELLPPLQGVIDSKTTRRRDLSQRYLSLRIARGMDYGQRHVVLIKVLASSNNETRRKE